MGALELRPFLPECRPLFLCGEDACLCKEEGGILSFLEGLADGFDELCCLFDLANAQMGPDGACQAGWRRERRFVGWIGGQREPQCTAEMIDALLFE
jgi:hypothetical protein